jgi:hypothetical protein
MDLLVLLVPLVEQARKDLVLLVPLVPLVEQGLKEPMDLLGH